MKRRPKSVKGALLVEVRGFWLELEKVTTKRHKLAEASGEAVYHYMQSYLSMRMSDFADVIEKLRDPPLSVRCKSRSWPGRGAARCEREIGHKGKHRGIAEHYGACKW